MTRPDLDVALSLISNRLARYLDCLVVELLDTLMQRVTGHIAEGLSKVTIVDDMYTLLGNGAETWSYACKTRAMGAAQRFPYSRLALRLSSSQFSCSTRWTVQ